MRLRALTIALLPLCGALSCQKEAAAPPAHESADVVSPVAQPKSADAAAPAAGDTKNAPGAAVPVRSNLPEAAAEANPVSPKAKDVAGVNRQTPTAGDAPVNKAPIATASARIRGLGTQHPITGRLHFAALADGAGVQVTGTLRGLSAGQHGIHVHEHGDCGGKDGLRAGGHFNPTQAAHGGLGASQSHAGDMGNLDADKNGIAQVSLILPAARLGSHAASLVGRAVIVHERADDLKSQPSGDAGGRVACGVIAAP